jgi:hypothetical protein
VSGDTERAIVVLLVATVAKVDHVFDRSNSIVPVFENVVRLRFSDPFTLRYSTNTVTESQIPVLAPARVMRRGNQPRWELIVIAMLDVDLGVTYSSKGQGPESFIRKEPHEVFWGGYLGHFADPDGNPWEVAHNPYWENDETGTPVRPS